jgi:hypothetical protein
MIFLQHPGVVFMPPCCFFTTAEVSAQKTREAWKAPMVLSGIQSPRSIKQRAAGGLSVAHGMPARID